MKPEDNVVQVGIDDGQGSIKTMLTVKSKEEQAN